MKGDKKDVGFFQDAIFGIQHAISAEHHAMESYSTSKRKIWLDVAKIVRPVRSKYLDIITKKENEQGYCISKHLLAFSQALKELGSRYQEENEDKLAEDCFKESLEMEKIILIINEYNKGG